MTRLSKTLLGAALSIAVLNACTGDSEPDSGTVVFDFVRDLEIAEIGFERSRIRAMDPIFSERMAVGWSDVGTDTRGSSFRWTLGPRASFWLFVTVPRDLTLVCRCRAFNWQGAPDQTLSVQTGDWHSETQVVPAAASELKFALPAAALDPGWNLLVLEPARHTPPQEVLENNTDPRRLAIRVEALEFRGLLNASPPTVEAERLRLPTGSGVRAYARWTPDLTWWLDSVREEGRARLGSYVLTPEGRRELETGPIEAPEGTAAVALELLAESSGSPWWRWPAASRDSARPDGEIWIEGARLLDLPIHGPGDDAAPEEAPSTTPPRGVIVYLIDTLRADRLGAYGSHRGLTPRLDQLATDAVVFTEARAQSAWTRPSVASIFTGLYPQRHGIGTRADGLAPEVETLAERLYAAGVETGAIITNGNISNKYGLGQGFATYRWLNESRRRESVHVPADELNRWGLWWLDQQLKKGDDQPFFLYLHATDPHGPYTPAEPFASRFAAGADRGLGRLKNLRAHRANEPGPPGMREQMEALYNAEVAWADHQIGLFFDALRERGMWHDLLLFVVADHGEEFYDHDAWEHGGTLYEEQLWMPLLVKPPSGLGAARRVRGPAGHVDLLPTILDALDIEFEPGAIDGRSLWPAIVGASDSAAGARSLSHLELAESSARSLVHGNWKVIEDLAVAQRHLYELDSDPKELHNLAEKWPLRAGLLNQVRRQMERVLALNHETAEEVELDEETIKQLEALGYGG